MKQILIPKGANLSASPVILLGFCIYTAQPWAAEWSVSNAIDSEVKYNDNRLFSPGKKQDSIGSISSVSSQLLREAEGALLKIAPKYGIERYDDSRNDDETIWLNMALKAEQQQSTWGLNSSYKRENILTNEFLITQLPIVFETDKPRNEWRVSPAYGYLIGPASTVFFSMAYADISYEGAARTALVNYTSTNMSLGYEKAISPNTKVTFSTFGLNLKTEIKVQETTGFGGEVKYSKELSDVSGFAVSSGAQENQRRYGLSHTENRETSWKYGFEYRNTMMYSQANISLSRLFEPGALGFLVERDVFTAGYRADIAQDHSILSTLHTSYNKERQETNVKDWVYGYAQIQYRWRFRTSLSLAASYRYSRAFYQDTDVDIDGNQFMVTIRYVHKG